MNMNATMADLSPMSTLPRRFNSDGLNSTSNGATNGSASRLTGTAPSGEQLLERAILLVLEMRRVGNRRRVSKDDVEVDAEKESIQVSKRLLEAKQLQNILTHDRLIRRYIKSRCLPSYFRPGVTLLPLVSVEIVDMRLQDFATQRGVGRAVRE